ncbi:TonB-dependent receptor [Sphingomonas sp. PL20]|uniref:TonB-dependent receptor n=1 Tax=Sphingomonas sp. PL20 TaxID=2760712 RepID=UPI001AE29202
MAPLARLLPFSAVLVAVPASAQSAASDIRVSAGPLAASIRVLGQQAHVSIGFRDMRLATLKAHAVRGHFTPAEALSRMLLDTGAWARQVAPDSFSIEPATSAPPRRLATERRRPAKPSPPSPDAPDEDIVVTATKRAIPLASYPGGAQVVDGRALSIAESARGSDAIEMRAASVSSTHLGPGRNKLFIRGIADSSFVGPTQATVGQYWGNSRITYSAPDPSLRLYDVRSIEVLEGPQGTLYGAGSLGGVVRVVPRAPDLYDASGQIWGGGQWVQHGSPGMDGGAIVNVPLVEGKLALRALAFGNYDGGYIDDVERKLDDVNKVHTVGGRAALRYEPGGGWSIDLTGLGQRIHGDDSQYADRGGSNLTRASAIAQPFRNDYWLVDLVARKTWGPIELTTSLGYSGQHVLEVFEGPTLNDPALPDVQPKANAASGAYSQDNRVKMLTAETRLARRGADGTGWVVGLSVLHNTALVKRGLDGDDHLVQFALTGVRNQVDEVTLYGEGTVELIDRLTLTAGGRATRSTLSGKAQDVADAIALRFDSNASSSRTETRFLPSVALAYRANRAWTVFARYQQGFRPGGIAVRQNFIQRFNGDRVQTAEGGARLGTRTLETSLTASWSDWRDIQADVIDGFGFPTTVNIGNGRVLSIGWSAKWHPTSHFSLEGAVYWNDSRIVSPSASAVTLVANSAITLAPGTGTQAGGTVAQVASTIDQSRLPNVADISGRLGFTYMTPLRAGNRFEVNGFSRYIGKSVLGIGGILGRPQGNYVDTGVDARIGNDRRGISLSLTNLLDTRGNRFALGSPFLIRTQDQITPLQPRSVRLGFDLAF